MPSPEVVSVPDPVPGPGQVLLKVTAAGMCHSDIAVMSWPADQLTFPLPMTLGHEGAGTVEALGEGVDGVAVGEPDAVYGPWGCVMCAQGKENYCLRAESWGYCRRGWARRGRSRSTRWWTIPRHLVPLGDLGPVRAPYWGSRAELVEVLESARAGVVDVHVETYSIDEAPKAYERLHAGRVNGRGVILPNG